MFSLCEDSKHDLDKVLRSENILIEELCKRNPSKVDNIGAERYIRNLLTVQKKSCERRNQEERVSNHC